MHIAKKREEKWTPHLEDSRRATCFFSCPLLECVFFASFFSVVSSPGLASSLQCYWASWTRHNESYSAALPLDTAWLPSSLSSVYRCSENVSNQASGVFSSTDISPMCFASSFGDGEPCRETLMGQRNNQDLPFIERTSEVHTVNGRKHEPRRRWSQIPLGLNYLS